MNPNTVCFSGFSREDEVQVLSLFEQANFQLPIKWVVTNENEAALIVIDMDTVYGHMTWLKASNDGKITAAVTSSDHGEANHVLPRPLTLDSLFQLLSLLTNHTPSANRTDHDIDYHAALAAELEVPVPIHRASTGNQAAMPRQNARELKLLDFLRSNVFEGPVKIQLNDAPLLVIDPVNKTYLGSNSLKPYIVYGSAILTESDFIAIENAEFSELSKQLGGSQPLARLTWLASLIGGNGHLLPSYDPNSSFQLSRWPPTEREFPKHFRIATVMMKGPAKLNEIAEQSGASLADVTDFVNANLISGHANA